jgi:tricorn protease-like protein
MTSLRVTSGASSADDRAGVLSLVMKPTVTLILALFVILLTGVSAQNPPLLAQQPALSATHIVFVFAGDLWSVPRQGGAAVRLTTSVGVESNPSFSPDGTSIARSWRS